MIRSFGQLNDQKNIYSTWYFKKYPQMGTGGLEPPHLLQRRILSPLCLPISPHSHILKPIITES